MTSALRIFSKMTACAGVTALAIALGLPAAAATVSGSIELMNSQDPLVRKHKDYSGVVVWLEPLNGTALRVALAEPRPAQMIQKNKRFTPHVLAIPVGSAVSFPNFDPIFHNAFSNFNGQIFDVGLYKPGSSRTVEFKREGIVRVFCNIHPQMSAVIVVLKTAYFAVSDKAGAFQIQNVPSGQYEFHVFHERATPETLHALDRKLTVENAALEVPSAAISESGYLQVAHKNKFGKDYPPVAEEQPVYTGARK
jgi:plastocyanin